LPAMDLPEARPGTRQAAEDAASAAPGTSPGPFASAPEQLVRCQNGTTIIASAVVLAVGHIPSAQPEERARLAAFAERRGGLYLPQGLPRSEEHTSELQSRFDLVCRLLLEKKK